MDRIKEEEEMVAKIYCIVCDDTYDIEMNSIDELDKGKCPKCGTEDIFYQCTGFKTDGEPVEIGRGGCGTVW